MKKNNPKKKSKAFTIIETVVAIGIFGIGVLAVVGFYATSSQAVRNARQVTTATFLAQGLLEETISESYDAMIVGAGTKQPFSSDLNNPIYSYQKKVDVSLIDQNLNASPTDIGLKKIDAYVYWQGSANEKQIQLSTIISQR